MFNWAKQQLANVAGTQEPIYGPSAIRTVTEQAEKSSTSYTELSRTDFTWTQLDSTSVETQSFYITAESGHVVLAQVIYSNVAGIRITCQFNTKIFYPPAEKKAPLWSSDPLSHVDFSTDKCSFYADDVALELSEDGNTYTIKSAVNKNSAVNLTIEKVAPAFAAGTDGKTLYGTDLSQPWGSMRHAFWPRARATGTIVTNAGTVNCAGGCLFIMAMQGMKPHHAAAKWTFANYQGPAYSAVMMEFHTPPSYGSARVNVGCVVKDKEILFVGTGESVEHTKVKRDGENEWEEPGGLRCQWRGKQGKGGDGKEGKATMDTDLTTRLDKVDIMAEVPGFVKTIVAAAAGTKPYIYQYAADPVTLKIDIGGESIEEKGCLFSEATFITAA